MYREQVAQNNYILIFLLTPGFKYSLNVITHICLEWVQNINFGIANSSGFRKC